MSETAKLVRVDSVLRALRRERRIVGRANLGYALGLDFAEDIVKRLASRRKGGKR